MTTTITGLIPAWVRPGDRVYMPGVGRALVRSVSADGRTCTIVMREAWYWRPWWWLGTARRAVVSFVRWWA